MNPRAEPFEVRIERIVAGGDGLGRLEGRVVFVPGAAPGERHLVEATRQRKDFARARSISILERSRERREAPCPYYERCGGCSLMHLLPVAQVEAKRGILMESLVRAGLGDEGEVRDLPVEVVSGPELGYRNRLRFHLAPDDGGARVGFRRRGGREVVDLDACLLASPGIAQALGGLRGLLRDRPLLGKFLAEAELMESGDGGGRIVARFFVRSIDGLRFFDATGEAEILRRCRLDGYVAFAWGRGRERGPRARAGETAIDHRVSDFVLTQSAESFFQTNRFLHDALVAATVGEERRGRVLDLHCGVGFFSLPFARLADSVLGVDSQASSVRDARENAERAGLGNVRFQRAEADRFIARARLREGDLVVVDPPRGGLSAELCEGLGGGPIRELRYVSCDPPAFARDAVRLRSRGFRLSRLHLIDLFPNTHLFETVASFTR